jgi:N6-adenosine-specific RNA methylase IME4
MQGEMTVNRAIQEMKRKQATENLNNIETIEAKEIEGVFDVIVIDPPWQMKKIERNVAPNQVEFEYPTMTLDEIKALEIPCADDCHIWLWTTHKYLPSAFDILKGWGLNYICTFVWHKPGGFQPFGLPQYNSEFALYARRGSPKFIDFKNFKLCFDAPRTGHSEKPELFYDLVRRVTAGRRLDMFNRRYIEGFETWGKEAV